MTTHTTDALMRDFYTRHSAMTDPQLYGRLFDELRVIYQAVPYGRSVQERLAALT